MLSADANRHVLSTMNFLWATFTRFDPAADIHAAKIELVGSRASFTPPIVIDARLKPGYPEELFCDERTVQLVDRRWLEFFGGRVEMGDPDRGRELRPSIRPNPRRSMPRFCMCAFLLLSSVEWGSEVSPAIQFFPKGGTRPSQPLAEGSVVP